ncbi:hypothetical protein LshimejAT787_0602010 [Lyophyllum shimeji]|uniref:HNH nuclease domain-containing protein n=1 Tax=Lyophyllum shimeji TaxID=47721 RepID=A0A9P3ULB3_LYOSH|nr:hypothetical protein LshimejAT787_0602010 [Lyophyllum shimeji]
MYYDHYIRAFRANKGNATYFGQHPPITHLSHVTAKKNALIRDGYRCVITGEYDICSVNEIRELHEKLTSDPSLRTGPTECAHIFAESTNSSIDPESAKRDYAATMWTIMCRFGHETLTDDLNGPKVHRLQHVMTMVPAGVALPFRPINDLARCNEGREQV